MATKNHTKPSESEVRDEIYEKALQLSALLANAYGEGGESFRNMNDSLQDSYLWACSDMVKTIINGMEQLNERGAAKLQSVEVSRG